MKHTPIWTEKRWTGSGFGDSSARLLKQVKREGDWAIYSVTVEKSGRLEGYEVVKIGRHNGYELGGNWIAPAETYPGAEGFGKNGWAVPTLELAENLFKQKKQEAEETEAKIASGEMKRRGRKRKS